MTSRSVEQFGAALADAGLPSLPARVFSALLMDDDGRMTSAELTGLLGVSAAAVSGAVKYLQHLQMIRREREPGSRRDVYVVDDDAWHGMMVRRDRLYAPLLRALDSALDEHLHEQGPDHPAYRRIRLSAEFLRYVDTELGKLADGWAVRKRELEGLET
jgi:DNA-binding transcriptional regulator GbsR (MarR family)